MSAAQLSDEARRIVASMTGEQRRELEAQLVRTLSEEALADYRPYAKQRQFHAAGNTHRERLLRAGNQLGKSYAGGAEMAYHLTGEYPDWWEGRRFTRPILGWAAGETAEATRDNPQRVLFGLPGEEGTGMLPKRCLTSDYGLSAGASGLFDYMKIRHSSGGFSMLRLKNYAQGRRKWQGPPVDCLWLDEEPPADIYDEGLARTIATGGMAYLTFTPLQGMSHVVRRFLMVDSPERSDTCITIYDAEHITPDQREIVIRSFPAHERQARSMGVPTLGQGRIFPLAEEAVTVAPMPIPAHWVQLGGMDFGWDHPSAFVRIAWDRDSDVVYVTNARKAARTLPAIHAEAVRPWGWDQLPWAWPADGYQTEKGTGIQLAVQYRKLGLNLLKEHAQFPEEREDTKQARTSVEAGLTDMLTRMETGRLKVFAGLEPWFEEFRLYHRETNAQGQTKIVKLDDDLMDATRYALMMLRFAESPRPKPTALDRPPRDWRV